LDNQARYTTVLNGEWKFYPDREGEGEKESWPSKGLPEQARTVRVPHTWNVDEGLEDYMGICWYEYKLEIPESWRARRVVLQFDGVYRDTLIWLNGSQIAEHAGSGYTRFFVDITASMKAGEINKLILSADNSFSDQALPHLHHFDWAADGGILREVSVIVTGRNAVKNVKITAVPLISGPAKDTARGTVFMEVQLWEDANGQSEELTAIVAIEEENGEKKVIWCNKQSVLPQNGRFTWSPVFLDEIRLWHFEHPHLYKLRMLLLRDCEITDEFTANFGFREIRTNGNQMLLNGEPIRVMGVEWMPGSHPDYGMAESEAVISDFLTKMKGANCVLTRFHWQQDPRVLDWCDRNGMLVQEEIPFWQKPAAPDHDQEYIVKRHLDAMIHNDYNHPSVIAWGLGNELNAQSPQTVAFMTDMKAYVREQDPTRLINYVSSTLHLNPAIDAAAVGDVLTWNGYIGTWVEGYDFEDVFEAIKRAYPNKPLIITEYGLCEPRFPGGDARRIEIVKKHTDAFRKHEFIAGAIFFSLNDYRTHMGENGVGRFKQRIHGVMDLYGNLKPSYEALKEVSSPIQIISAERLSEMTVSLVLIARDDFPRYLLKGYRVEWRTQENGRWAAANLPDIVPGQTVKVVVNQDHADFGQLVVKVIRPTGGTVLEKQLRVNDGRLFVSEI